MTRSLVPSALWLLAVSAPLLVAVLLVPPSFRRRAIAAAPWAAAPALALAFSIPPDTFVEIPWLFLGMRLGLDDTGRVFLLFSGAVWIACAAYARAYMAEDRRQHRFMAFLLACMAGNLGVVLAADAATFYLFFALMSFSAYGLVVHDGRSESLRAGRVYIAFVVAGEVLVFTGLMGAADAAGRADFTAIREALASSASGGVVALLVAGFGIKMGAAPLHVWLPLAHGAAPTPASAALSGLMIKAGLLGWLRVLPLGDAAFPAAGMVCIAAGMAGAFWGVVAGLTQENPKTLLAYSSVSQMGLITAGVGVSLHTPETWGLMLPAIWLFALHHAFAKAALFLGVGVLPYGRARRLMLAGMLLPAAALAGVPLSSGAVAKISLKQGIDAASPSVLMGLMLALASVGTTLLMVRFLVLVWPPKTATREPLARGTGVPWIGVLAGVALSVWVLPWAAFRGAATGSLAPAYLWSALWPPAVGTGIAWLAWRLPQLSGPASTIRIPAGDLLSLFGRLPDVRRLTLRDGSPRGVLHAVTAPLHGRLANSAVRRRAARVEAALQRWESVGAFLLVLVLLLAWLA